MKLAAYDALIGRLEASAVANPWWYRTRVIALASLGYAVVVAVFLVGCGFLAIAVAIGVLAAHQSNLSAVAVKGGLLCVALGGFLCWSVLRAMWSGEGRPAGVQLTPDEGGDLLAEIDSLRRSLGAPAVHRVIITRDLNAALIQRPRLGFFGWHENLLVLGLPLLRRLGVDEARAVVVHELGHLAGNHGRFGAWIHRLRTTWSILAERSGGSQPMKWFLSWYAPLFNAYTFVLARSHEREADRATAQLTSGQAGGTALLRLVVLTHQERAFWSALTVAAAREPQPPRDLLARFDRQLAEPTGEATRLVAEALHRRNDRVDPHPCLRERLELHGWPAPQLRPGLVPVARASRSAATVWLGRVENDLAHQLDAAWADDLDAYWRHRFEEAKPLRERRAALEALRISGAISSGERWELALAVRDLDGAEAADPLLEELLTSDPTHAQALYLLGSRLVERGDRRGVVLLEAAMKLDPEAIAPASALISDFADRSGQRDLQESAEARSEARNELERLAAAERAAVPAPKKLVPHGLDAAALAPLRTVLARIPDVAAADLAGITVTHLPERRFFLLVVRVATPWWKWRSQEADTLLVQTVAAELSRSSGLPGQIFVIVPGGTNKAAAKRAAKQAGARIHPQG